MIRSRVWQVRITAAVCRSGFFHLRSYRSLERDKADSTVRMKPSTAWQDTAGISRCVLFMLTRSRDRCYCSVFTALIGPRGAPVQPVKPEPETDSGRGGQEEGCTSQGGGRACHRGRGLLLHIRLLLSLQAGGARRTLSSADTRIIAHPGWKMVLLLSVIILHTVGVLGGASAASHCEYRTFLRAPVSSAPPRAGADAGRVRYLSAGLLQGRRGSSWA